MKDIYKNLSQNVRSRLNPEHILLEKSFIDELSSISYSDVLTYVRLAMKGVEPSYTQKSVEAGENAKMHLSAIPNTEFRFQGSVMTNTHIKAYSDIDLLTICSKFYTWDRWKIEDFISQPSTRLSLNQSDLAKIERERNISQYQGTPLDDLRVLRLACETILTSKYSICDTSKPKSIKITNQNLRRDADVVVANWFDDLESIINDRGDQRGIEVYNKHLHAKENPDYPFISIKRINERGSLTHGRIKKMIRFLKNIKADSSSDIELSSFDINAICYDISLSSYQNASYKELVQVLYLQLRSICHDPNHAARLTSVDGREHIFNKPGKLENVQKILAEVEGVYLDLKRQFLL